MKKRKIWAWLMATLVAMAAVLIGIVWDAHRRATAIFERHEREVAAGFAVIRARPPARHLSIFGELEVGNGWPALLKALDGMNAIPDSDANKIPEVKGDSLSEETPDDAAVEAVFVKHAAVLEELREALRNEWCDPRYPYEQGFSMPLDHLAPALKTARFLAGLATHRHRTGRNAEAFEPLLEVLAFSQDIGQKGSVVSFLVESVCENIAAEAWRTVLEDHQVSAAELERAVRSLDLLRARRVDCIDCLGIEDLVSRQTLVQLGRAGEEGTFIQGPFKGRSWRHLFSRRIAYAATLAECERYYRKVRDLAGVLPSQREAAARAIEGEIRKDSNGIVAAILPQVFQVFRRDAIAQMNWTMMRVATALAWYEAEKGAPPASLADLVPRYLPSVPECPLTGKPLGYAPGKVWSFGVDGVDNGGTPSPKGDEEPGGDVVWVVRRKK